MFRRLPLQIARAACMKDAAKPLVPPPIRADEAALPLHSCFSTSSRLNEIILLTRLRVVDNSALGKQAMMEGKPPKCIHVYNKTGRGTLGDKVMVAIKGQKRRGYIVGVKQVQKSMIPRMDSNNLVLIDDNGNPLGNRVLVPIPSMLRGKGGEFSKIIALCSRFV